LTTNAFFLAKFVIFARNYKPFNIVFMIRLNCFFQANDQVQFNEALQAAKSLVEKSLKHEGVVAYDVFTSATRPDVFMICETWQNQDVLDKHSATPEFAQHVGTMQRCGSLKPESFNF
jgi:quinol monooxygenase YgiN